MPFKLETRRDFGMALFPYNLCLLGLEGLDQHFSFCEADVPSGPGPFTFFTPEGNLVMSRRRNTVSEGSFHST